MEDNNNSLYVKAIAAALILVLGLNVYRTETTKKQMDALSSKVESLSARIDSLEFPSFPEIGSVPVSDASSKQISTLSKSVANLESKVNSLQKSIDGISASRQQAASSSSQPKPVNSATSTSASSSASTPVQSPSFGRVSVTSKVKVEDRYVEKSSLPQVTTGPEGTVVINVTIDPGGNVSRAKVGTGTTIKDEDILDKCKEAALKTRFNINVYVSSNHPGTITYTFIAK